MYALGQLEIIVADITQNNAYNPFGSAQGGGLYVAVNPTQRIGGSVVAHNYVYSGELPATGGGIFARCSEPTVSWTVDEGFILAPRCALVICARRDTTGTLGIPSVSTQIGALRRGRAANIRSAKAPAPNSPELAGNGTGSRSRRTPELAEEPKSPSAAEIASNV